MSKIQMYDKYITSPILIKDDWFYHKISNFHIKRYLTMGILPRVSTKTRPTDYYSGYNG